MAEEQPESKWQKITIGGARRGIASNPAESIPRGHVFNLENFLFTPDGVHTALGWKTIDEGFETSGSWPGAASGGWNSVTYGRHIDYFNNSSGKVILFAGAGRCDSATGKQFVAATSNVIAMPAGQSEFLGVTYFADTFLVYTKNKMYSLAIATGVLTEQVEFAADIGAEYGPILTMFQRFGQLWIVTEEDRIYWSDVREFTVGAGAAVTDQGIEFKKAVWQDVYKGKLVSIEAVEYEIAKSYGTGTMFGNARALWGVTVISAGKAYCVLLGASELSVGDDLTGYYIGSDHHMRGVPRTIDTIAALSFTLQANATAGENFVRFVQDADDTWTTVKPGDLVTVAGGGNSEEHEVVSVTPTATGVWVYFDSLDTLVNSYTTSHTATFNNLYKVVVTTAWNINSNYLESAEWTTLASAYYDTCLDPDNDDDCGGHIRLHIDVPGSMVRIDYTPYENDFTTDEAGWVEFATEKGDNVAIVEGPNYNEDEGADILYVFKSNGDIHALTGKPGPGGTFGTLDPKFITSGVRARKNSIQVTRQGVYFGAFNGIKYDVYFIPHGDRLLTKEQIPRLTEEYFFDTDIPFDDESYTFYERTAILNGDHYLIAFSYSTSGLPSANGYMYACQAYRDKGDETGEPVIRGAWGRLPASHEAEYEDDSSKAVASGGEPVISGFYWHKGDERTDLMKVYYLKTGHDYSGNTRYYEIAQYGWYAGGEECKSLHIFTTDDGASVYTTRTSTEYFWAKIDWGMLSFADQLNIQKWLFDMDLIGGLSGDGISVILDAYRDFDYANSLGGYPATITHRTDAITGDAAPRLLKEHDASIICKYFQLKLKFDKIKYNDHPAYVLFRGLGVKASVVGGERLLDEEV